MWDESTCVQYDKYFWQVIYNNIDRQTAFSELTYDELEHMIEELSSIFDSKSARETCQRLVRLITHKAYELGYTSIFDDEKNEVEDEDDDEYVYDEETQEETERGKENAELLIYKPRSMSLADSINVCKYLIDNVGARGEALGYLIMMTASERTSEAAGIIVKDYITINGRKYIARVRVLDQSSIEIELGGKTTNAYRYTLVPSFLEKIIDERIKVLKERFGGKNISELPLVCSGTDYKRPASQKEINEMFGEAFEACNVNENIAKAALEFYSRDTAVQIDSGGDLTAYIGRHQFFTDAYACGITIDYLQMSAGHKVTDLYSEREDQSNPDVLTNINEYLDRRPLIRLLNNDLEYATYEYTGEEPKIYSGDRYSVKIKRGSNAIVTVRSDEPGDFANVEMSGGSVNAQIIMPSQPNINRGIYNRSYLLSDARIKHFLESCDEEKIVDATSVFTPLRPDDVFRFSLNDKIERDIFQMPNDGKPVENTQKAETTHNIAQSDIVPKKYANLENVYVLFRRGDEVILQTIDQRFGVIGEYGAEGIDLHLDGEPLGLYYISPTHHIYAHGEDSTIRQVVFQNNKFSADWAPDGKFSFNKLTTFNKNERAKGLIALKTSGELQINRDIKGEPTIILNDDYQNKKIIDALFTCKRFGNRDILIGTENGLGLRVSQADICDYSKQLKKSAIKITEGDAPAFVVHYPDPNKKEEVVFVSDSGSLCKRGSDVLSLHNLGTQGQRLLPLGEKWITAIESKPGDIILLLGNNGKLLCLDTTELKKTSTPGSGKREGMTGTTICGAICVPMLKTG